MTQALSEALAEIDDPKMIMNLLQEYDDGFQASPGAADQPTLRELYQRYLRRRNDRSPATRSQYKRTIPDFVDFAEKHDITVPSEITSELVDSYTDELFGQYETDATILTYTKNARAWLNWLSKRSACDKAVAQILNKDDLGLSPTARDEAVPEAEAQHLLKRLRQQRRGTAIHAILALLWNGGLRIGGVHSLDLQDLDAENNDLFIRHRDDQGTRLKNGAIKDATPGDGERDIKLHPRVVDAITRYIRFERPDVTDEYGREPLFATQYGRTSRSTLRRWVYEATSCRWAANGPIEITCDGSCDPDSNVCPHSYYPHAVRRGAIVSHLSGGLRPDRASGRFNVSTQVLKDHYDPRTKQQRKKDREEAVKEAWSEL